MEESSQVGDSQMSLVGSFSVFLLHSPVNAHSTYALYHSDGIEAECALEEEQRGSGRSLEDDADTPLQREKHARLDIESADALGMRDRPSLGESEEADMSEDPIAALTTELAVDTVDPGLFGSEDKERKVTDEKAGAAQPLTAVESVKLPPNMKPPPQPRPPLWERGGGTWRTHGIQLATFKRKQLETLERFRSVAKRGKWDRLHNDHFDWWMWPIEDGSQSKYNVLTQEDVDTLKSDPEWRKNYLEAVQLCAAAWGWNLIAEQRFDPPIKGQGWTSWDVRLAKMVRSLWLFEEVQAFRSLQQFAVSLVWKEKRGQSFRYGGICLDEILSMRLPRR